MSNKMRLVKLLGNRGTDRMIDHSAENKCKLVILLDNSLFLDNNDIKWLFK